jgi:hypothetical protein
MKSIGKRIALLLLLACLLLARGDKPITKVIFVEPVLRFLTQCEFTGISNGQVNCQREGLTSAISLSQNVTIWKGTDRHDAQALSKGDMLDIKLGLDAESQEVATFIWANLVRIEGVAGRRAGRSWLRVHPLVPFSVGELAGQPVFAFIDGNTSITGPAKLDTLPQGTPLIVIGERLDNQRIRATRVLVSQR